MFKDDFLEIIEREQKMNKLTARQIEILFGRWQGWLSHLKNGRLSAVRIDRKMENGLKALGLRVALIPVDEDPVAKWEDKKALNAALRRIEENGSLTDYSKDFMKEWERARSRIRGRKRT